MRLLFFCFCVNIVFSQNFKGTVLDENKVPISNAVVFIKETINDNNFTSFVKTNTEGNFFLNFNSKIYVEIRKNTHEVLIDSIVNINPKIFTLIRKNEIETVVISKRAVIQKKDTITYDTSYLKNGNEKKLEDALLNIQGIEINKEGKIYFRGKEIQNIQIDGDDLFQDNYTIASKNINLSIIDKIEIIERYNKNKIKKKYENTDNVSINLKLKESEYDLTNDLNFSIGQILNNRFLYKINPNSLLINSRKKAFLNVHFSNLGDKVNSTFFDKKNNNLYTNEYLTSREINSLFESTKYLNNKIQDINLNAITKINNSFSLNSSFQVLKENETFTEKNATNFFVNDLVYNDFFETNNVNTIKQTTFNLNYFINNKTQYTNQINYGVLDKEHYNLINLNNISSFNLTKTNWSKFSFKNEFNRVLSNKILLNFYSDFYYNNNYQNALFESIYNQNVLAKTILIDNKFEILYSNKKHKLNFNISTISKYYNFISDYDNINIIQNKNDLDFDSKNFKFNILYNFNFSNFNLKTSTYFGSVYNKLNYNDINQKLTQSLFYFNPSLILDYEKKNTFLSFSWAIENLPVSENQLYNNYIQTSNRELEKNNYNFNNYLLKKLDFKYKYNNIFSGYSLLFNYNLVKSNGNIILKNEITPQFILHVKENSKLENTSENLILSFEKYLKNLRTNVKLGCLFTNNKESNLINEEQNLNNYIIYNFNIFFKSSFKSFFNFQSKINKNIETLSINRIKQFKNNRLIFDHKFLFKILNKKALIIPNLNHYILQNTSKKNVLFLNLETNYRFNNKTEINFKINNILDVQNFEEVNISSLFYSNYNYSLNRLNFLLTYSFSF